MVRNSVEIEIDGLEILRLLYLYPDKKTEKLIDLFATNAKIAPYFSNSSRDTRE